MEFGSSRRAAGGAEGHDREGIDLNKPPHCLPEARLRVNNVTVTFRLARCIHPGGFEEDRIARCGNTTGT